MESIWKKCKVLTEFSENKQTFEFVDCKQILNESGVPCSMDMIRCDNGERVYFAGLQADLTFLWVDEKYTEEA